MAASNASAPLFASTGCRGSLANSAGHARDIHLYPTIVKDFERALLKAEPNVEDTNLGYVLRTLYNVVARENGYDDLDSSYLPLKVLKKLPYSVQIEYFTRLKNHWLLSETPPENLVPTNNSGTPQYLRSKERELVKTLLKKYNLPDIEKTIVSLDPLSPKDLEGKTLEIYYLSDVKSFIFEIDIADDGTAVAHSDGELLAAGPWKLIDGFLEIESKTKIKLDLRSTTTYELQDVHTELGRIHEWGPIAMIQVRYVNYTDF